MQAFHDVGDTVPDANVHFVPFSDNQENQILPNQYVDGMYEPAVDTSIDPSLQPFIPYYGIYDPNAVNPGWMMNEMAYQYEDANMPICEFEGLMSYDAGYQYPIENNADWFAGGDNGSHDPRMMQGFDGDYQGACYIGMEAGAYGNSPSPEHAATCVRSLENDMMRMEIRNSSEINERSDYGFVPSLAGGGPKKLWCDDEDPMQILTRPGDLQNVEFGANDGSKQTSSLSFSLSSSLSHPHNSWSASRKRPTSISGRMTDQPENVYPPSNDLATSSPVLDMLFNANRYNPKEFELNPRNARFFIIKSYSEDDIHRSIKYGIWCSTEYGNRRLDGAYKERNGKGPVYLFFSVNGSGHFCGMAQMSSPVDYQASSGVWAQSKWKGQFDVRWIYVKDVPNSQLRHIRLENNEHKPVTNSRDTQEVPPEKGKQVLKILHQYYHTTSIFDDFVHYEKRQLEDSIKQNPGSRL